MCARCIIARSLSMSVNCDFLSPHVKDSSDTAIYVLRFARIGRLLVSFISIYIHVRVTNVRV